MTVIKVGINYMRGWSTNIQFTQTYNVHKHTSKHTILVLFTSLSLTIILLIVWLPTSFTICVIVVNLESTFIADSLMFCKKLYRRLVCVYMCVFFKLCILRHRHRHRESRTMDSNSGCFFRGWIQSGDCSCWDMCNVSPVCLILHNVEMYTKNWICFYVQLLLYFVSVKIN